ncbi:unnamed protein product [Rhodiola kirilowii]
MLEEFKQSMKAEFEMTDLGVMKYFLGVEIIQGNSGIFMCQRRYAREILERFKLESCNAVRNPIVPGAKLIKDDTCKKSDSHLYKQMVGCLMYLAATRPDIMYVLSLVCRFMENPSDSHMQAVKRIFRYVKGTMEYGIWYRKDCNRKMIAFSDSDYAGDVESR